jgi:hypothetical protein
MISSAVVSWHRRRENIPLLHLVETLKGWDGDKDDNSLLAVANFNLQSDQSQHAISTSQMTVVRSPSDIHNQSRAGHQVYVPKPIES